MKIQRSKDLDPRSLSQIFTITDLRFFGNWKNSIFIHDHLCPVPAHLLHTNQFWSKVTIHNLITWKTNSSNYLTTFYLMAIYSDGNTCDYIMAPLSMLCTYSFQLDLFAIGIITCVPNTKVKVLEKKVELFNICPSAILLSSEIPACSTCPKNTSCKAP